MLHWSVSSRLFSRHPVEVRQCIAWRMPTSFQCAAAERPERHVRTNMPEHTLAVIYGSSTDGIGVSATDRLVITLRASRRGAVACAVEKTRVGETGTKLEPSRRETGNPEPSVGKLGERNHLIFFWSG